MGKVTASNRRMDIYRVLEELAKERPLFHSEADFQQEVAFLIRSTAGAKVRLETPIAGLAGRAALDILVIEETGKTAVELKYLKQAMSLEHEGEVFNLPATGARDISRYDCCKDIRRLEHLVGAGAVDRGYLIVLTNDPGFWKPGVKIDAFDVGFHLWDGRVVTGSLAWSTNAGKGTVTKREEPIELSGNYVISWRDFSYPSEHRYAKFRVLVVEVATGAPFQKSLEKGTTTMAANPPSRGLRSQELASLREFFRDQVSDEFRMTFGEIEKLRGPLPASAVRHQAWWYHVESHPHAVWELEGFKASPDIRAKTVTFKRDRKMPPP